MQMENQIPIRPPDLVLINVKKTYYLVDFVVLADI